MMHVYCYIGTLHECAICGCGLVLFELCSIFETIGKTTLEETLFDGIGL